MSSKKLAKSDKVSVSKTQMAETANAMETVAVTAAIAGQMEVMDGAELMQEAGDMARTSAALGMAGASDLTRAVDEKIVAERLGVLSDVVAGAGIVDVAEGAAILAESDDVNVMSALVGMMSEDSLDHGLELARLSGELQTVGELVAELKMPVLSAFLTARSTRLHDMSLEQIHTAVSTQGVSDLLAASGTKIGELGENEVEEGITRLGVAGVAAERSAAMSRASDELAEQGIEEVVAAKVVGQIAREAAIEGAKEISTGSAVVGAAMALDEVATELKEKSK